MKRNVKLNEKSLCNVSEMNNLVFDKTQDSRIRPAPTVLWIRASDGQKLLKMDPRATIGSKLIIAVNKGRLKVIASSSVNIGFNFPSLYCAS